MMCCISATNCNSQPIINVLFSHLINIQCKVGKIICIYFIYNDMVRLCQKRVINDALRIGQYIGSIWNFIWSKDVSVFIYCNIIG